MSIAGLKLTFPSRTRLIRGLATMVLHIRVWESSSMPGFFFAQKLGKKNMWSFRITLHTAQQCFIFSVKKMLHAPQVRFIKRFLISDFFPESGFFFCPEFSYDGTAHSSVGELRQGKRNLFLLLFCLFRQTIEKSFGIFRKIYQFSVFRCRIFFTERYAEANIFL